MNNEAYILASGPSVKELDLSVFAGKDVITVNHSIFYISAAKYHITTDYTWLSKIDKERYAAIQDVTKIFVADMSYPYIKEARGVIHDTQRGIFYDLSPFDVIIKSRAQYGIGYTLKDFRTGMNSGFCALQLAVALGYKNIYLAGIDLLPREIQYFYQETSSYSARFAGNLQKFYEYFRVALEQLRHTDINVYSITKASRLVCENIIPYKQL